MIELDVMCSTPQLTQIPGCSQDSDDTISPITHIAIGTNLTIACVEKKKVYVWGSGLGSQLRVPTPLKVSYYYFFICFFYYCL